MTGLQIPANARWTAAVGNTALHTGVVQPHPVLRHGIREAEC